MTTSTSVSPEWIKWARKKWRERVTNHGILTPEVKLRLLSLEDTFPEGKTTLAGKGLDDFVVDSDPNGQLLVTAIDLSLVTVDSYKGNDFIRLSMPMSLDSWARLCEQKKQREAAESGEHADA